MNKYFFIIIIFFSCSGFGNKESLNGNKISFDNTRWYQMTHAEKGINELFDGKLTSTVSVGFVSVLVQAANDAVTSNPKNTFFIILVLN